MSIFSSINISASALTAEKTRIDVISKNMANVNTTRTSGGVPYKRQLPVFQEESGSSFKSFFNKSKTKIENGGVKISGVIEDTATPHRLKYEPGHPHANEDGYVEMPNVDTVKEMVDLISAQRGYDANVTAINSSKSMLMKALEIGRG